MAEKEKTERAPVIVHAVDVRVVDGKIGAASDTIIPTTCGDCGVALGEGEGWDVLQAWDGSELHYCTEHFRAYRRRLYGTAAADLMEQSMGGYER